MPQASFEFELKGLDEASRIGKHYDKAKIKQALIKGGLAIEALAKQTSLVDTGRLRASYSTNWDGSSFEQGKVDSKAKAEDGVSRPEKEPGDLAVVRVGSNVEYAYWVEFGTSKMPPAYTLTNAASFLERTIEGLVMDAIEESNEE